MRRSLNDTEPEQPLGGCRSVWLRGRIVWRGGPAVLLASLLVAGSGCDYLAKWTGARDGDGAGKTHEVAFDKVGRETADVSGTLEAPTEENALKAYFRGKKSLSMAYFAKDEAKAKQYSAEAERWFERSLRFYVPDIEAMVAGKKALHGSANWEFLKGVHEAWSESIRLSGKRVASKEYIDKNVKDAWALSVISRMIQGEESVERRRALIEGKFPEIREILEGSDKYASQLAGKNAGAGRKGATTVRAPAPAETREPPAAKGTGPASPARPLAKAGVVSSKMGLDAGLVAEDPLSGKAVFSVPIAPVSTGTFANVVMSAETRRPTAVVETGSVKGARQEADKAASAPAAFRTSFSMPAKIYLGNRLHTLGASPGKIYIGDRVYTLPSPEKPPSPAER